MVNSTFWVRFKAFISFEHLSTVDPMLLNFP